MSAACGTPRTHNTDPDFVEYVHRFEQETGREVKVPIIFSNVSDEYAGVCEYYNDGYRLIRISSFHWDRLTEFGKEELIYHELGHCVLNRDHTEDFTIVSPYRYSIPNSIMYPYLFGDAFFYYLFREHYVQELIHPGLRLGS